MSLKIQNVTRKINYYSLWYDEMPMGERVGWQGKWVADRITFLTNALLELQAEQLKSA